MPTEWRADFRAGWERALDVVWPRVCAVRDCARRVDRPQGCLCSRCWDALPWYGETTAAAVAYLDPVDGLVQAFKFGGRRHLAGTFAEAMATQLAKHPADAAAVDVVVPVPLHPLRLRERGYNQSELLARPLARALGRRMDAGALLRKIDTPHQSRLSREERLENLKGAFAVDFPERVRGRVVLLVDDVSTTGATLEACAAALRRAGAARVMPFTFARAVRDDDAE